MPIWQVQSGQEAPRREERRLLASETDEVGGGRAEDTGQRPAEVGRNTVRAEPVGQDERVRRSSPVVHNRFHERNDDRVRTTDGESHKDMLHCTHADIMLYLNVVIQPSYVLPHCTSGCPKLPHLTRRLSTRSTASRLPFHPSSPCQIRQPHPLRRLPGSRDLQAGCPPPR